MSDSIEAYLEALASKRPTPGGGSAATLVGAMAASLVSMVARISSENAAYADRAGETHGIVRDADAVREALVAARHADERAYGRVVEAMALPKETEHEKATRRSEIQRALAGAAAAPLHAAALALEALHLTRRADALGNAHLVSDVDCAIVFARASIAASACNVRINHAFLKDRTLIDEQEAQLRAIETTAALEAPR